MDSEKKISDAIDLMADGKDAEAEKLIKLCLEHFRALSLSGEAVAADHFHWGICLEIQEEFEQALLKYEKALEQDPKHEPALWKIASVLMYDLGKADLAVTILEEKLIPGNPDNQEYKEALVDAKSYLAKAQVKPAEKEQPEK